MTKSLRERAEQATQEVQGILGVSAEEHPKEIEDAIEQAIINALLEERHRCEMWPLNVVMKTGTRRTRLPTKSAALIQRWWQIFRLCAKELINRGEGSTLYLAGFFQYQFTGNASKATGQPWLTAACLQGANLSNHFDER
jgi:hypothetical protein